MYNTLSIKVEGIPGAELTKTVSDMMELAQRLGIMVETNFNGCNLYITKNSKHQSVLDAYHKYCLHVAKPSLDSLS